MNFSNLRVTRIRPRASMRPSWVGMKAAAKSVFIEFFNRHAKLLAQMEGRQAAMYSKLRGYAARFALIDHCVRQAAAEPGIDPWSMDEHSVIVGVGLGNWFGNEAMRVYAAETETPEDVELRE